MGGADASEAVAPAVLVGPADIARLSGVRRPAVSNWRRRFDDFPAPVAGTAANPLFTLEAVHTWCREHGKPFEADRTELLWQRVRSVVPDVRRLEFMAYAGRLLTGPPPAGDRPEGVPGEWTDLAGEILAGDGPEPVFEELCARLVRERGRAETPPELAAWMAELAGIGEGDSVLDPACGMGALLTAALRRGASALYGQDSDPDALHVATALLAVSAGVSATAVGDSLRSPAFGGTRVDAVLCDPPFRDREWGLEELADDPRWVHGVPPRGEGELAWVQHALSRVRPGGRAVVLVPASVSSRPGGRRLRAGLVRSGALRAVLEVPEEGASEVLRHVWILVRPEGEAVPGGRVLLVGADAGREGSARIWAAFASGAVPPDPAAGTAPVWTAPEAAPLLDEEVDLRPARRLAAALECRAGVHYPPLLASLTDALEQARSLARELALEPAEDGTGTTTLGALADSGAVELHRAPLAMTTEEGTIPVLTVRDLRGGGAASGLCARVPGLVMTRPGDVVVAETVRGAPVRVVTGKEEAAALGPRLLLVRAVEGRTDRGFLAGLFSSLPETAARTSTGRLDVRALRVPSLSLEEQRAHGRAVEALERNGELLERIAEMGGRLARLGRRGLEEGNLRPRELER
ncbi:class I SAM-dependent DNA methyltransferase [Nocardiopsis sp. FR26]|uniref:HsdM family class I SAM-dependent methyltransferase n=1 Tax=Nocardiopsis sp. FR26 TaxID=2605987 RepID=UPI001356B406|nr:N-6 DNA methylase [Nocardiopsis sp. FR26]